DDGLDPSHYIFAPEMFNDSLYKSSGAELELMTDMDDYLTVENNAEIGYMLEIDLEAPVHLHDFFADYPLAPEKQI
ncbi:10169_t:CDS:2, partial [Funneliformis geosporum]